MKEIPILYSTPMVQAKLAGRKTQTRRIMKIQPESDAYYQMRICDTDKGYGCIIDYNQGDENPFVKCPYGRPGDILWVRESWSYSYQWEAYQAAGIGPYDYEKYPVHIYRADRTEPKGWRPSIHMRKDAARIWERVKSISVERVQEITVDDCICEGIKFDEDSGYFFAGDEILSGDAQGCYEALWKKLNGFESWHSNPWVWVIETETLSATGRPKDL